MPPPPSPPDAPADAKAGRLAAALRANLRRRKAAAAVDPSAPSRVDDGVDGGEGLYPPGRGASGDA